MLLGANAVLLAQHFPDRPIYVTKKTPAEQLLCDTLSRFASECDAARNLPPSEASDIPLFAYIDGAEPPETPRKFTYADEAVC